MKKSGLIAFIFIAAFACKNDNSDPDLIPHVPVNTTINISLPQYIGLQNIGNFVYLEGGHRGLYVFHNYSDEYVAYDRSCAYKPYESCAQVSVDTAQLTLKCACCQSEYMMDGTLKQGPAVRSMKQYNVYRSGDLLQITN